MESTRHEHVRTIVSIIAQLVLAALCAVVFFWMLAGANAFSEDMSNLRSGSSSRARPGRVSSFSLTVLSLLFLSGAGALTFVATSILTVYHASRQAARRRQEEGELREMARRVARAHSRKQGREPMA